MLLCDFCCHPVLPGMNCPFCGNDRTTKRCEECSSVMLALPTELNESKVQHICQMCAMEGKVQSKQP